MDPKDITRKCACFLQTNISILSGIRRHCNDTEMKCDKPVKNVQSSIIMKMYNLIFKVTTAPADRETLLPHWT